MKTLLVKQSDLCDTFIYIYIYIFFFQNSILKILQKVAAIMENAEKKYLNGVKHDRNKYLNNAPIKDNI